MNYLVRFHRRGRHEVRCIRKSYDMASKEQRGLGGLSTESRHQHLTWPFMPQDSIIRWLDPGQMQASHVSMVRESPKQS